MNFPCAVEHDLRRYEAQVECISGNEVFSDSHVEQFIKDFASSEGDACMWLEDQGIGGQAFGADVLRKLARAWQTNPMGVYAVAGVEFWREMKQCAIDRFES